MTQWTTVLDLACRSAQEYLEMTGERTVRATSSSEELHRALGGPLSDKGADGATLIRSLTEQAREGTVTTQGGRFFGFVVGSSFPIATATDWLVSAWDQNAGIHVLSPLAAVLEQIVTEWIFDIVGLPKTWSSGYVTGGMMANFTSLAAARHHVLAAVGWDVEENGVAGAPPIDILVSEEAHYSIANSLRMLGLGAKRARRVPTDAQGRMRIDALMKMSKESSGPCIICAQAGNVNTGAFDPLDQIADLTHERGAWFHVDSAFGLWAAASPSRKHQLKGIERADSIGTDAHKWLNVPYDCGIALCAHPESHRAAMTIPAPYIVRSPLERDEHEYTPEESRRARAIPIYAVLKTLGRNGLRELVEGCCRHARRFGEGLSEAGFEVLNDIVLNQVLISFGSAEVTKQVIEGIQRDGTCWVAGTEWQGKTAMRISVSSWATTDEDVERSLDAMIRAARQVKKSTGA